MESLSVPAQSAVGEFVDFLKIKSVSGEGPSGSYKEACFFLVKFLTEKLGPSLCKLETHEFVPNKPVVAGGSFFRPNSCADDL